MQRFRSLRALASPEASEALVLSHQSSTTEKGGNDVTHSGRSPKLISRWHEGRFAALAASSRARLLAALASLLLLAAPSAASAAEVTHPFLFSFDGSETPAGSFGKADGIAVDAATGDVYVADLANNVIDKFDSEGHYLSQIDGSETPAGSLSLSSLVGTQANPAALAVDNSSGPDAGDLYVTAAPGVREVQSLTPPASGTYTLTFKGQTTAPLAAGASATEVREALAGLSTIGGGVVQTEAIGGEIRITFQNTTDDEQISPSGGSPPASVSTLVQGAPPIVDRFDSTGKYLSQVGAGAFSRPMLGLATDAQGNVWTYSGTPGTNEEKPVAKFSPGGEGSPVFHFDTGAFGVEPGLAVDSNDDSYTVREVGVDKWSSQGQPIGEDGLVDGVITGLAADLSTDEVYIKINNSNKPEFSEPAILEFGPSGSELAHFGEAKLSSGGEGGIAVDPVTGTIYAVSSANAKVYAFAANPGPRLAPPTVNEITATTATAHATVNPEGAQVAECAIEYGTGLTYGQTAPCEAEGGGSIGAGSEPVAVIAHLTGLHGATAYHLRLVASNPNGSNQSADRSFETLVVPVIEAAEATEVELTSATLTARVNPNGLAVTSCQIEWGPTPEPGNPAIAYEHAEPCQPGSLPAGTEPLPVSLHLTGLATGTTYHWRLVATDVNGTATTLEHTFVHLTRGPGSEACGNESLRAEDASFALPDCRAYEQVSPTHKQGALLGATGFGLFPAVSEDGSRLMTISIQCFADAASCTANRVFQGSPYLFASSPTGWQTTALSPSSALSPANTALLVDPTANTALFSGSPSLGAQDDFFARQPGGPFLDLGPTSPPAQGAQGVVAQEYSATPDLSHVAWEARPIWPFDPLIGSSLISSIYGYPGAAGHPLMVDVSGGYESNTPLSTCGATFSLPQGRLSADGRTVFFTADGGKACFSGSSSSTPVPADALYARVENELPGAHTVLVSGRSPTDCTVPSGCQGSAPRAASFQGASTDGSKAYFASTQQLTDAASQDPNSQDSAAGQNCADTTGFNGCNLYLYDFSKPAGEELTAVSAGNASGGGPRVQGIEAISADGSHVYFVAKGTLTAGPGPVAGRDNLYVYDASTSTTSFITILPPTDFPYWTNSFPGHAARQANVTPDGRELVFPSHGDLTADATGESGSAQIYRYDAQTESLIRISIGDRGFDDNGNRPLADHCRESGGECAEDASLVPESLAYPDPRTNPTMSDDGSRIFFTSPLALAPGALEDVQIASVEGTPEYAQNVYEWEQAGLGSCPAARRNGCVYLLSDGRDTSPTRKAPICSALSSVCLLGTDATGKNTFFSTADRLLSSDTNSELDYYDAVAGGGLPRVAEPVLCPTAESCHPGTTAEAPASQPATGTFNGPEEGPQHPMKPKKHKHKKHRKKHAKKSPKHGQAGANRGGQK
jgi:hypothetical protein